VRFIFSVLGIWGAMHAYAWLRVRAYAGLGAAWSVALAFALAALMASPVAGMWLARSGHAVSGHILSSIGMVWAGVFFLFFWISVLHDVYNGLLTVAGLVIPAARSVRLVGPWSVGGEAILVALLTVYSFYEAWHVTTERVELRTAKLPPDLPHVRIVEISDVHLGASVGRGRLRRILRAVNEAKPDLLLSLGDLVDAERGDMTQLTEMLAAVEAPLGKYAVTGNHEYYFGLADALAFTRKAGFRMLMNESARVTPGLSLAGFEDEGGHYYGGEGRKWDEAPIVRQAAQGDYVIVLKHRPFVNSESLPSMDLQLSGHTHRGQIFPFTLFILAYYPYGPGLQEPAPGKYLYTSRGAGTWGPPMRFLNPPEVTVVDLIRSPG
jgi:predicted MPP superfamily phosphohydrolase